MKKIFALSLSMVMLLTACSNQTPTTPLQKDPIDIQNKEYIESIKGNNNIDNYKNEVIEYSKDDEIIKLLESKGYVLKDGYALHPSEKHFFPKEVIVNNELKTIYLSTEQFVLNTDIYPEMDSISINTTGLNVQGIGSSQSKDSFIGSLMDSAVGNINSFVGVQSESVAAPGASYGGFVNENFNTSEYKNVEESNYLSVKTNPLSTFAADVDTASYANFRSILRNAIEFPYYHDEMHDVRIEEMVNYFDYSYSDNAEIINDKFAISAEIGQTPWNKDTQLLVVNVKAKELTNEEYKGSNLVFLIDTSGSMNEDNKLPLLKESMKLLIERLTEKDRVSIVTYSGDSAILADGLTGADKDELNKIIDSLNPYGSTNGEGGMKAAYEIAAKYQNETDNSRIIMCSDGDLNVGISSEDELHDFVSKKKETGIYLSVLGFGLGNYSDTNMEVLADNGNGNYHYIDSLQEGQKVLVSEFLSTIVTLADDVKFQLEFNPNYIKGYRKIGYENRNMADSDFNDDTKDGGEIGYGHEVTVVYEIIPITSEMEVPGSDLKYQENTPIDTEIKDWLTVSIRYKDHGTDESQLIEYIVDDTHLKDTPTTDWKYISNVVGLGLIINRSEYKGDLTITEIIKNLNSLELDDEFKKEFLGLTICYKHYLENILSDN